MMEVICHQHRRIHKISLNQKILFMKKLSYQFHLMGPQNMQCVGLMQCGIEWLMKPPMLGSRT
jgi:hypothetical protein